MTLEFSIAEMMKTLRLIHIALLVLMDRVR